MRAFRNQNFIVSWFTNLRNLLERMIFSFQFRKIITRYRRIGYNLNVMRRSACLVFNKNVQVGNDQEKAQSERNSHSKNQGGKKLN